MIRLRQVALVAHDLEPVATALCETFQLSICVRDLDVSEFGLTNALMVVGDQFIEIITPVTEGTAGGRMLERRGGDSGYMVLHEVDDLDDRLADLADRNVRIIWAADHHDIRGRHLHPKDVGGAIVSLDEAIPEGSWRWAATRGPLTVTTPLSRRSPVSRLARTNPKRCVHVGRNLECQPRSPLRTPGLEAKESTKLISLPPTADEWENVTTSAASPGCSSNSGILSVNTLGGRQPTR